MKVIGISLVVVCLVGPSSSYAQVPTPSQIFINCGRVYESNEADRFGHFNLWMEYRVSTTRDLSFCPLSVAVEAHVPGVADSGAADGGLVAAFVRRQILVPYPGVWQSKGRHGFVFWLPAFPASIPYPFDLPPTSASALITAPDPDPDPWFDCEVLQGGRWSGSGCELPNCPLIVDTARDGYALTSVENGVRFDLDADGVPEQVAWTRRGSDEAFLALDRNGNGRIDDGSELFGNHTPAYPNRRDVTTANGFEALRFVETPGYGPSRRDEVIDARDAVFSRLLLWRDRNHNGLSEPDELEPVSESGLLSIGTDYKNRKRVDRYGNEFRQRGQVVWAGGQVDDIFDVWLAWRN